MKRQRADGTWTFTTVDWDNAWYWPVGTRVRVLDTRRHVDETGTVIKQNSVSVRVRFDSGRTDIDLVHKQSDAQDRGEGLLRLESK